MKHLLSILRNQCLDRLMSIRRSLGISGHLRLGNIRITLPADHKLGKYKKQHPKYDAFLPHLCSHFPPNSYLIDIGANVGDTLAGIVSENSNLKICCIEPDQEFLKYLKVNLEIIKSIFPHINVTVLPYLIGREFSDISLKGSGGTKHAVPGDGNLQTIQLDQALNDDPQRISLIKSDVDGFDFDVINSGLERIKIDKPLIFMEFFLQNTDHLKEYMATSRILQSIGYSKFVAFDNYGGFMVKSGDISVLEQLAEYTIKGQVGNLTRTIDYLDVLFLTKNDDEFIDNVLRSY
jgi:FkbM family methyltransferase